MEWRWLVIELGRVRWHDRTYFIDSYQPQTALRGSLDRHGLLGSCSVWVRPDGEYTIVDGFKRLGWAADNGWKTLPAAVFPASSDPAFLWRIRLETKLFGTPLNLAEKAQLVAKLAEVLGEPRTFDECLPVLGMARRPHVVEDMCRLAVAGNEILEAAASGVLCERAALALVAWEDRGRRTGLQLLLQLKCSASIQIEILDQASDIALRDGIDPAELLGRPELRAILDEPRWNPRRRTQAVRDLLFHWRHPRLTEKLASFAEQAARSGLPAGAQLVPPPAFEGNRWRLELAFTEAQELDRMLPELARWVRSRPLQGFFR
jgi:hypothetical protein